MAYIQAEIKLPAIQRSMVTNLYFPTDLPESVGNKVKGVITLLHGLSNTGADWMMMTAATRYAADNGYILVAPNAENSFYTDMRYGAPFYTAITELLPRQLRSIFKIPDEREKNYICGLSMGGYGALKIGLSHPERYAACGSFSGSTDLAAMIQEAKGTPYQDLLVEPLYGHNATLPAEDNLMLLAEKVSALPKTQQPRIYCSVGRQDDEPGFIYAQNQVFRKKAESLPLDFSYNEWDGLHEWNFWDRSLAEFIGFVQNSDYGERKKQDWAVT